MSSRKEVDVYDDRPYTPEEFREWWNSTCAWYIGVVMEQLKETTDQSQRTKLMVSCARLNRIRKALKLTTQTAPTQPRDALVKRHFWKTEKPTIEPTTSSVDNLWTSKQPVAVDGHHYASSAAQPSALKSFVIPKLKHNDNNDQNKEREQKKGDSISSHSKHETSSRRSRSRSPKKSWVMSNQTEEVFVFGRPHCSRSPERNSRSRSPRPIDKLKTRTCQNWKNGQCKNGDDCRFAHFDVQRLANPCPNKLKTVICNRIKNGYCHFGSSCWFIHPDDGDINDCDKHARARR
ncbi:hypothetical protein M3Y98_00039100 [Aphelenchoides besseyi]|nr:hypothetical protein M3Y98_00039100 [Aphelenchoides besseyi]KAI6199057.1 hypothetical protein M3Y96_00586200 [Aphelenchoides besseyi]